MYCVPTYAHLLLYNMMINNICDVVNNISNWKCHRVRLIFYYFFLPILDTAHAVKKNIITITYIYKHMTVLLYIYCLGDNMATVNYSRTRFAASPVAGACGHFCRLSPYRR